MNGLPCIELFKIQGIIRDEHSFIISDARRQFVIRSALQTKMDHMVRLKPSFIGNIYKTRVQALVYEEFHPFLRDAFQALANPLYGTRIAPRCARPSPQRMSFGVERS